MTLVLISVSVSMFYIPFCFWQTHVVLIRLDLRIPFKNAKCLTGASALPLSTHLGPFVNGRRSGGIVLLVGFWSVELGVVQFNGN